MESSQQAYDGALDLYQQAKGWHADFLAAEAAGDKLTAAERRHSLAQTAPPGLWEHWKSGNEPGMTPSNDHWKFYVVQGLELKGGEFEVDYPGLYGANAGQPFRRSLLDPEEGFLMPIDRPGWQPRPYVGPRFQLIRPLTPRECEKLIAEAGRIAAYPMRADAYVAILHVLGS